MKLVQTKATPQSNNKSTEKVRGSIDVPATPEGLVPVAKKFRALEKANPGKQFLVISSQQTRAKQTANVLISGGKASEAKDLGLIDSRAYGALEGQIITPDISKKLERLANNIDLIPDGKNKLSTRSGESTRAFVVRTMKALRAALITARNHPNIIPVVVTFNSVIKAMEWALESEGDEKKIRKYLGHGGYGAGVSGPGSMHVVVPGAKGKRFLRDWDAKKAIPEGGVVLVRHGATSYNKEQSG
jgi:broad specificity phosphatase PhoE